ncbi:hypothetical protein C5167_049072 [Papaver somniferum]|uniref:Uncharacterized protein n=1 Tax=Papaver somniferum TaxID=3469 RepID=A0A4Y7KN39_PAPSO|nr:hypothetical protein C5167_049072 [Papaver somniferum]
MQLFWNQVAHKEVLIISCIPLPVPSRFEEIQNKAVKSLNHSWIKQSLLSWTNSWGYAEAVGETTFVRCSRVTENS